MISPLCTKKADIDNNDDNDSSPLAIRAQQGHIA